MTATHTHTHGTPAEQAEWRARREVNKARVQAQVREEGGGRTRSAGSKSPRASRSASFFSARVGGLTGAGALVAVRRALEAPLEASLPHVLLSPRRPSPSSSPPLPPPTPPTAPPPPRLASAPRGAVALAESLDWAADAAAPVEPPSLGRPLHCEKRGLRPLPTGSTNAAAHAIASSHAHHSPRATTVSTSTRAAWLTRFNARATRSSASVSSSSATPSALTADRARSRMAPATWWHTFGARACTVHAHAASTTARRPWSSSPESAHEPPSPPSAAASLAARRAAIAGAKLARRRARSGDRAGAAQLAVSPRASGQDDGDGDGEGGGGGGGDEPSDVDGTLCAHDAEDAEDAEVAGTGSATASTPTSTSTSTSASTSASASALASASARALSRSRSVHCCSSHAASRPMADRMCARNSVRRAWRIRQARVAYSRSACWRAPRAGLSGGNASTRAAAAGARDAARRIAARMLRMRARAATRRTTRDGH